MRAASNRFDRCHANAAAAETFQLIRLHCFVIGITVNQFFTILLLRSHTFRHCRDILRKVNYQAMICERETVDLIVQKLSFFDVHIGYLTLQAEVLPFGN